MSLSYREGASSVNHTELCQTSYSPGTVKPPLVDSSLPQQTAHLSESTDSSEKKSHSKKWKVDCFTPTSKRRISRVASSGSRGSSKEDGLSVQQPGGDTRVSRPHQVVTGVDKLEVTIWLRISDYQIFERFSRLKNEVQQGMKPYIAVDFGTKEDFTWNLQRTGNKLYPYILKSGDITLLLSSRPHQSTMPNCKIEIGSVSSQEGAFIMFQNLLEWLEVFGLTYHKGIPSRVDLAADYIGQSFEELAVENHKCWIRRGKKLNTYMDGNRFTGIDIGTSRLMLRIYDKSFELKKNKAKEDFFLNLWKCKKGTPVVRVEFQLRHDVLKNFEIPVNTVQELKQNLDSLWQYLTRDWARLTVNEVDRKNKNQKQAKTDPFWIEVQETVFNVVSPKNCRNIKKNLHKNLHALRDQVRGCIINFAAAAGHDVNDHDGIITTCVNIVSQDLSDYMKNKYTDFVRLFEVRRNECYVGF